MNTRTRPAGCCTPVAVDRLPAATRDRIAAAGRALADPTRIEILRLLADQTGPLCACDIVERFELSQPTVSHHLRTLREAGLVRGEKKGLWMFYSVEAPAAGLLDELARRLGSHGEAGLPA